MTTGFFTKDDNEMDYTADSEDGFWGLSARQNAPSTQEEAEQTEKTDETKANSVENAAVKDAVKKTPDPRDDVMPPWFKWRYGMSANYELYDDYDPRNDFMPYVDLGSDSNSAGNSEASRAEEYDTEAAESSDVTTSLPRIEATPSDEMLPQIGQSVAELDTADGDDAYEDDAYEDDAYEDDAYEDDAYEDDAYEEMQDQSVGAAVQQDLEWDDELSWDDDPDAPATFIPPTNNTDAAIGAGEEQDANEDPAQEVNVAPGGTAAYEYDSLPNESEGKRAGFSAKRPLRNVFIAAGIVVALVVAYAFGVWYFSTHYLPNTRINGLPVATKTVGGAQSALEEETADYACIVSIDDFETTIHGTDIQIERNEESMASEVMEKQSAYMWPIALVTPQNVDVDAEVTFNEDAAQAIFAAAVDAYNEEKLPKTNASVNYDEETGLYEIAGTTTGTMVDGGQAVSAVLADVKAFARESQPASAAYVREATAQDIPSFAHNVAIANAVYSTDIPILVDGEEVAYAYASENPTLLSITEGSLHVDKEQLRAWAEYSVADAVFHMDDWSFYYLDVDEFVEEFAERLQTGNVEGYEAPTYDELRTEGVSRELAYSRGGWDSELGRYIDVDLEAQFARLFDDNGTVLWESAFVSGEVYAGRSTVTGVFSIYAMQTNTVLVGMDYNNDGQPDYESYVNYWMPFYGGYGLHDATWRANFGGEYYYYNGSHGCVNLPYSKAEELYSMTYVGETVSVHW